MDKQMHIVYETLESLEITDKKIITLFNKMDKLEITVLRDFRADRTLKISARTGQGLSEVKAVLEEFLREDKCLLEGIFPYEEAGQIQQVRKYGELLEEDYRENGIYIKAFVPSEIFHKLERKIL